MRFIILISYASCSAEWHFRCQSKDNVINNYNFSNKKHQLSFFHISKWIVTVMLLLQPASSAEKSSVFCATLDEAAVLPYGEASIETHPSDYEACY